MKRTRLFFVLIALLGMVLAACGGNVGGDGTPPDPPPATPTGLGATPGDGEVALRWNPNSEEDLARYNIFVGASSDELDNIGSVGAGDETATVTGLSNGDTFFFAVNAEDAAGQTSDLSEVVSATPRADGGNGGGRGLEPCPTTFSIVELAFDPAECAMEAGTTITYVNNDDVPHTVTSKPSAPEAFDSGTLQPGESFELTLTTAGTYDYQCDFHPGAMQGTIVVTGGEEEPPPDNESGSLQFQAVDLTVDENGGSVTVTVTRTGGSDGAVSADFATADGSASAGSDYTAISGSLNWADGDDEPKAFSIPILDDGNIEGDETVALELANVSGGAILGAPNSVTLTIVDNDEDPAAGLEPCPLRILLYSEPDFACTVTAGTNITFQNGTLEPAHSVTSRPDAPDDFDSGALAGGGTFSLGESFEVNFGVPGTYHYFCTEHPDDPDEQGTVVVTPGNDPGTLQFSAEAYTVAEDGGSATITVTREGGSDGIVSVGVSTFPIGGPATGGATQGEDFVDVFGTLTWAAGDSSPKTFEVPILDDSDVEQDEILELNLSFTANGGAAVGTPDEAILTIVENDEDGGSGLETCPDTIEIVDFAFDPAACKVSPGTIITFVNNDEAPHTATSKVGAPEAFDTGNLAPGESATVTFSEIGSYDYFCQIHPSMEGVIVVEEP